MPVLHKEPCLWPEGLLDSPSREAADLRWMVLHTKPRQEKAVAREMLRQEAAFYLPLVRKTLQYRQRRLASYLPLFPGYLFLYASEAQRAKTLATNRVLRILTVDDAQRLVADLRQLHQLIAAGAPLTVESRLVPGDRVRVKHGPFADIEGVVLHRRGATRLLVSINFLQRGASVEIEDFLLEPLG
jgi:transcription antitermination factor NusG